MSRHLCPADDDRPDLARERMFFTLRSNGQRIDAIREQLAQWQSEGRIAADEMAYVLASLIYATSYASNTSSVFKGFHCGWGGKTGTALYRIRGRLALTPPVLFDNGQANQVLREDASRLPADWANWPAEGRRSCISIRPTTSIRTGATTTFSTRWPSGTSRRCARASA